MYVCLTLYFYFWVLNSNQWRGVVEENDDNKITDPAGNQVRLPSNKPPDQPTDEDANISFGKEGFGIDLDRAQPTNNKNESQRSAYNTLAEIQKDQAQAHEAQLKKAKTEAERESSLPTANTPQNNIDSIGRPQNQPDKNKPTNTEPDKINNTAQNIAKKLQDAIAPNDSAKTVENQLAKNLWLKTLQVFQAIAAWIGANLPLVIVIILVVAVVVKLVLPMHLGSEGKATNQPASAVGNKSLLGRLSLLTGDQTAQKKLTSDVLMNVKKDLLALKDLSTVAATKTKIDTAAAAIDKYIATPSADLGKSIIDQAKSIIADIDNAPFPQIQGHLPVNADQLSTFNTDLHIGSPLFQSTTGTSGGHGVYTKNSKNKCDAVDITTNDNTDVYPALPGTIVDISSDGSNLAGAKKVLIKNGKYQLVYAFFAPLDSLKVNDKVEMTKPIGKTISKTLHIELSYDGTCVVTTILDQIDKKGSSPKYTNWGAYLWDHMKTVLKL